MKNPEESFRGVQLPLRAENLKEVYIFYPGHYAIYPESGHNGAPTKIIEAERIGKKVHGLTGYCSLTEIHLFYNGSDWQRSAGTNFGAFADKAHKRKL